MPCTTRLISPGQTEAQRRAQVQAALKRLEAQLQSGKVSVQVGPQGAVAFVGWVDRDDVTDVCAVRMLRSVGSWSFGQAVTQAELRAGRRVDWKTVAQGVHTHDGGVTWSRH